MLSRRDFGRLSAGGLVLGATAGRASAAVAKLDYTVRGVNLGVTSGSFNPLPEVPGQDRLDTVIAQYVQVGVGTVELANGTFGPALRDIFQGHPTLPATPVYLESREARRRWRLSPEGVTQFRGAKAKFDASPLTVFSISQTFEEDCTDAEIDAIFQHLQALGVQRFHSNQTRVIMGPRLVPYVAKYKIKPSFHPHAASSDPREIGSAATLEYLMGLSPDFNVCLDIGHFTAGNEDSVSFLLRHHERITHLHVKDRKRNQGPNVEWGTGDTPIRECLTLIRDQRLPIRVIMEREFAGTGTPVQEVAKNLGYMRNILEA